MSELDVYLLVTLFCALCGFFIGLGQKLMRIEKETNESLSDVVRGLSPFVSLIGMGYLTAWILVSDQPVIKLIPVFILAVICGRMGAGLGSSSTSAWLPTAGMILMPATFHAARYLSFI